jgi:hypothetical protein
VKPVKALFNCGRRKEMVHVLIGSYIESLLGVLPKAQM